MQTTSWPNHAAEIYTADGPTGRFAEVLAGEVRDYGGNVLYRGLPDFCVLRTGPGHPVRLVPTEWREIAGDVAGADHRWQPVLAR